MMFMAMGVLQIVLAILLWHRITPKARKCNIMIGLKIWFVGLALACHGVNWILYSIGYNMSTFMLMAGNVSLIAAASIWIFRWHDVHRFISIPMPHLGRLEWPSKK